MIFNRGAMIRSKQEITKAKPIAKRVGDQSEAIGKQGFSESRGRASRSLGTCLCPRGTPASHGNDKASVKNNSISKLE